jgi:hypothetical protein
MVFNLQRSLEIFYQYFAFQKKKKNVPTNVDWALFYYYIPVQLYFIQ